MTQIGFQAELCISVRGPLLIQATESGPWGVDAIALRDSEDFLLIPGDQVQGKVREALEQIAPNSEPSGRSIELHRSVQRAKSSADYSASQTDNLDAPANRYPVQFSDFRSVKPYPCSVQSTLTHVQMDPHTGSAEPGMLRVLDCPLKPGEVAQFVGQVRFVAKDESAARGQFSRLQQALNWTLSFGSRKSVGFGRLTRVDCSQATIQHFRPQQDPTSFRGCLGAFIDFSFLDPVCCPEGVANGNLYETRQEIPGEALRGAVAGLLHRILGTDSGQPDFPASANPQMPFQALCRLFSRIRITTARPMKPDDHRSSGRRIALPPIIPRSLGILPTSQFKGSENDGPVQLQNGDGLQDKGSLPPRGMHDFATLTQEAEQILCATAAPAFFPDWKGADWDKVASHFGHIHVPTTLRVRTAIDSQRRRAQTGNLFAYKSLQPEGVVWRSLLSIDRRPDSSGKAPDEADCQAALGEILSLLNTGWLNISKTKARGCGTIAGIIRDTPDVQPLHVDGKWVYVIVLRGPTLMIDPRQCLSEGCLKSPAQISQLFSEYWSEVSGGRLKEIPERRFQSNSLIGGFQARQYRYNPDLKSDVRTECDLQKRKNQQRTFPYNPTLVVNPGSVFVLEFDREQEPQARQCVRDWLAYGLPLPQWACRAYGDTHHTNIFLPLNGYGEIEVAQASFDTQLPDWPQLHTSPAVIKLRNSGAADQDLSATPIRSSLNVRLTTISPLAIHTGLSTHDQRALGIRNLQEFFRRADKVHAGVRDCDALVARDHDGNPYIPGSSIKGVVREWLTRPGFYDQYRTIVDWILGTAAGVANGEALDDQIQGGAVIFEDAFLDSQQVLASPRECYDPFYEPSSYTFLEQHTSINRRTGAVKQGALFTTEAVRAGVSFQTNVILDHDPDAEKHLMAVELLKAAFSAFNSEVHQVPPQLGSETRNGWGRIRCEIRSAGNLPSDAPISLAVQAQAETANAASRPRRRRILAHICLNFCGPFTTMDPAKTVICHEGKQNPATPLPDSSPRIRSLITTTNAPAGSTWPRQATPVLPAASFKGAFRSHMETILRTIHPGIGVSPFGQLQPVTTESPEFVWRLLGSESHQSSLWCSDFVGEKCQDLFLREMVAIDRFTGGAAESMKYSALVFQAPSMKGWLAVDLPDDNKTARAMLGALTLTLRDLLQGHLTFGYGETKGFGQCTAQIKSLKHSGIDLAALTGHHELPVPDSLTQWLFKVVTLLTRRESDESVIQANQYLNVFLDAVRTNSAEPVSQ